jgi:tetratricopeptide (TPR) repeat protein
VSKVGRNERCGCGSGKKYKNCCARVGTNAAIEPAETRLLVSMAQSARYAEMEAKALELLARDATCGFVWKALSVALEAQGKDALAALEKAALLLPDDAEAHSNLGAALRRSGRLAEAEARYRRALVLRPQAAQVWSNLGNVLRDQGQFKEALTACERSIELNPGLAKSHNGRGNALRDLGRLDDAAASYRCALALDPRYADAYCNLGLVLRAQGRWVEAQQMGRHALEASPECAAALRLLGELSSDRGQFTAAEEYFRRALTHETGCAEALAGLVRFRRMRPEDGEWLEHAQRVLDRGLKSRQEMCLRYAMGKYFDDLEEPEPAFEHYRRANELAQRLGAGHDREQVTRGIDRIIEVFDAQWSRSLEAAGDGSDRPVFIVGMPRSGTTLAQQILAAHPLVFGAGELSYWNDVASGYAAWTPGEGDALRRLARGYLGVLEGLSSDARRVVDKMPGNFLYLGLIQRALPNARIIHLRRNPLDTCLSIYFQDFGSLHSYAHDLEDLAHYYRQYLRLMAHWRRVLPEESIWEVSYEQLVQDAEGTSRLMVKHVGLEWDESCLQFHASSGPLSTFSKWQARQRINTGSVERWRKYQRFLAPILPLAEAPARSG